LKVRTREAFPQDWAMTQNNLGAAYRNRIRGDRAENLEKAIAAYQAALKVYTREAFPQDWAMTQNNLGAAYSDRIRGDRAENLEKAIAAYQEALQVRTPTADPIKCLETGRNLGNLALAESRWELAMHGYDTAIQAVEQSREWVTLLQRKREILEAALDVYEKMVRACISAKQWERALETVERSKSRQLVELLANADLYPKGAPAELKQELNQLRRRISAAQQFLEEIEIAGEEKAAGTSGNLSTEYIKQQRQQQEQIRKESQPQLDKLLNQIKEFDPQFTLTQRVEPITFEEIRQLIDSETAILEWHIGTEGFQTFIITGNPLEVVQFAGDELQQLEAWAVEYLGDYGETTWGDSLAERLNTLSQILRLGEMVAKIPPTCSRLVLIPHRYLHLFPLHALPVSPTCRREAQPATNSGGETGVTNAQGESFAATNSGGETEVTSAQGEAFAATNSGGETEVTSANASPLQGYCLLDEFPAGVRYAPSCQLLQRVQNRQRPAAVPRFLFAIQNPTKDLSYADIEVEVIQRDFDPHTRILPREEATKTALLQNLDILRRTGTAHFSCHGGFNFEFPLSSSLILAESLESPSPSPHPPTPSPKKGEGEEVEEGNKRYLTLRDGRKANPERCLTLQDIFASLELPQCRLVTLSACETGLTGAAQGIDEYIGLPSGFLYAGSLSVVSSLWRVDDFATAVLMIKFYQCLRGGDSGESGVPVALNTAQTWLRNVTKEEFLNWVTGLGLDTEYNKKAQLLVNCSDDDKLFHKPQYWAAFGAIGH
jgi:CHAT domain-containing protein